MHLGSLQRRKILNDKSAWVISGGLAWRRREGLLRGRHELIDAAA
jgi:hypothetical protein